MELYKQGVVGVKPAVRREWPGWCGIGVAVMLVGGVWSALGHAQERGTGTAPEAVQLDPVVVTATRTETPLSQVGSAVTVITAEELEQQQIRIVSDVLREVPGLAVNRAGAVGQFTQLRIRGSEGNHTLVLIDGIEVNDPSAGSEFDLSQLLATDIERIEILRGPQSVLYGSDAIGGVVHIITKRGRGRPTFTGSLEGGSFGTGQVQAGVSGGGEQYHYSASGTVFHTDGISVASERRGNRELDSDAHGTLFGKAGVSLMQPLELDFVGRYTRFRAEGDGFEGGRGAVDASTYATGEQFFGRAQAKLRLFAGRWEHILGVGYTQHTRNFFTNDEHTSHFFGSKRKFDYQTNVSLATPALADARHTVTFAVDSEVETAVSTSAFADFDRDIETHGFAGQYQLSPFERLFLSAGVRYDRNNLFKDATTYRATLAYLLKESGTKFKASYGTGVKNPTLFELFGFTPTFRGNPNLKPEKGEGWDIGMVQTLFGGRLALEATYFDQRIDNLIVGSGRTSRNLAGESRAYGVEVAAMLNLISGLDLHSTYTFTHTRDPDGNKLVRRPQHTGSVNVNYRFLEDRANVNLGIIYNGRQSDVAFDADFNRSIVRPGAYTLVNLAASYQLTPNVQLVGRIENLFDEHYEEVFTFGTPGRAAYGGVRVRF
ncbi:MAG: TonB-dependent receptor [Deltaproteobacteria bacterium]|nr:TonB-dependent receptor [Deltaproteobacteria bacterium]